MSYCTPPFLSFLAVPSPWIGSSFAAWAVPMARKWVGRRAALSSSADFIFDRMAENVPGMVFPNAQFRSKVNRSELI